MEFSELVVAVRMQLDPSFKMGTDEIVQSTKKIETSMERTAITTRSLTRPLMDAAQGVTALGAATYAAGSTMGESGKQIQEVGAGVMAVGSATMLTMPLLKAFNSVISGELKSSVDSFAKSLDLTTTQLTGIGAVIGVTATAALLLYKYRQDDATKATKDHEQALKDAKNATEDYSGALKNLQRLKDEQAGIPTEESQLRRDIERNKIYLGQAQARTKKGTKEERELAALDVGDIQSRIDKDQKALDELIKRKDVVPREISAADTAVKEAEWGAYTANLVAKYGPYKGPGGVTETYTRSGTGMYNAGMPNVDIATGKVSPTFQIGTVNITSEGYADLGGGWALRATRNQTG